MATGSGIRARLQGKARAAGLQEGLKGLVNQPPARPLRGPYIQQQGIPTGPWGRPYHYRIPGQHGEYDLYSLGADDAPGGTGENQDVTSW